MTARALTGTALGSCPVQTACPEANLRGLRACPGVVLGAMCGTLGHALAMHQGRFGGIPGDSAECLGHGLGLFPGNVRDSQACLGYTLGSF